MLQRNPLTAGAKGFFPQTIPRIDGPALKNEIAALRAPPPPPKPPPHSGKDGDAQIKLPTAEDVARARAFIADTWHRLVEMIENWQKDMLRKS